MSAWIALALATVGSLALRAGPSMIARGASLPPALERSQRFVTPALLGALASHALAEQAVAGPALPVVVATAAALAIMVRTGSVVAALTVGVALHLLVTSMLV